MIIRSSVDQMINILYRMSMETSERHTCISELLQASGNVTVAEIAVRTGASPATIRRDLSMMDEQGLLRRTHGGAKLSTGQHNASLPYSERTHVGSEVKARMAQAVASQLTTGEHIFLDTGTSTLAVAEAITTLSLTVTAVSLRVATTLADAGDIRLMIPGGQVRPIEHALVGPMTIASLSAQNFDTAIFSGCGTSIAHGVTAMDPADAEVKATALANTKRAILLCDEAKWGTVTFAPVAELGAFSLIVTDHHPSNEEQRFFDVHNIEVVTV